MKELIFGIFWLMITTTVFKGFIGSDSFMTVAPFGIIFFGIGLFLIFSGVKKVIRDTKTNKHGKETYGVILDVRVHHKRDSSDTSTLTIAYYDVKNNTVVETHHFLDKVSIVYRAGKYIRLKYYEDDINLKHSVEPENIPPHIYKALYDIQQHKGTISPLDQMFGLNKNVPPAPIDVINEKPKTFHSVCPSCGAANTSNNDFCEYCGNDLVK